MNGITILDNDTVVVKVDKLQQMINDTVWKQISRLERRFEELSQQQDKIVTKNEAIKMLGISSSTYDNWIKNGNLVGHKIGDKPLLYMSDIKKAMKPVN
ncbi:helix-turn-helix transcriptional regulator [Kaistella jeonii]|uniref:Helix-turn-helix domain-containing protein n=1 Tax=Kaistella jeonii TaxID=266749 RepID=A0A0C1FPW4_9FLAO|nr:hypothetical protein [Kaistella jeonii]KIA89909.1 hypothetical protein OA86_04660 [Kaistella jeonii]SFB81363.1 DNA binding domain-containing protein, excisionase family [Kaistella jeonii]VEI96152.1 Uncharacterised protein [Kaistella jeonii]